MNTFFFILWAVSVVFTGWMNDIDWMSYGRLHVGFLLRDATGLLLCIRLVAYFYATSFNVGGMLMFAVLSLMCGFWFASNVPSLWSEKSEFRPWFEKKFPRYFSA